MNKKLASYFLFLIVGFTSSVFGQYSASNPGYIALLANDLMVAPNQYEFDIVLKHTGQDTLFECQGLQIGLLFNSRIKNGGDLSAEYISGSSQFVASQLPGNPILGEVTGAPNIGILRIVPKAAILPGNGTSISPSGTRFGRFRISTSSTSFDTSLPNLAWNFSTSSGRYPTKISAWIKEDSVEYVLAREISLQSSHINLLDNSPYAAELTGLAASILERDVTLSWETNSETSYSLFQVERASSSTSTIQEWKIIGEVNANGKNTSSKEYSFSDKNLDTGKYIYRLKISAEGKFLYSKVVEATIE